LPRRGVTVTTAKRARLLAEMVDGKLQNELFGIAALYDRLADGKGDPDEQYLPPSARQPRSLAAEQRAEISAKLAQLMLG